MTIATLGIWDEICNLLRPGKYAVLMPFAYAFLTQRDAEQFAALHRLSGDVVLRQIPAYVVARTRSLLRDDRYARVTISTGTVPQNVNTIGGDAYFPKTTRCDGISEAIAIAQAWAKKWSTLLFEAEDEPYVLVEHPAQGHLACFLNGQSLAADMFPL